MGDDAMVVGLTIAIVMISTLVVGHWILFPFLHRVANLQPHLAIRLAATLVCVLAWAVAGFLVPLTRGRVFFWATGSAIGWVVLALVLVWLGFVWLYPPGPNPGPSRA